MTTAATPSRRRLIYSVELELDAGPGPQSQVLVCPLDRDGNTEHSYVLGKHRMIDVRIGDEVQHARGRWKVIGVKARAETWVEEGEEVSAGDGYLVRSG